MSASERKKTPQEHIDGIFKEYTTPSRVLRTFTNLSNTVIQTALSGQNKFILEILQNADDSFENEHKAIKVQFILEDDYLIVQHDGKGFDYNDVERICDYASQIEEVKANDLSKTGYKGLGFKTLFNLSDCIIIYSNGYSFRFDKTYWPDSSSRPWQVIPIWCRYEELPLTWKYAYDQPVNFILKVNDVNLLRSQLKEIVDRPEVLLYLNRTNNLSVHFDRNTQSLEKKGETFGLFNKVNIYNNRRLASTWLLRTYTQTVPTDVQNYMQGASRFVYPDKIKTAKAVPLTFALKSNETLEEISKIKGLCHSTLPTQLHLTLPYHINCFFILNLDRTQLHENEWNTFLVHQMGRLQLNLLKDLAELPNLKNYVIMLFVRKIEHPYAVFSNAFLKGFNEAKTVTGWLPPYEGSRLLKLGEGWIDETKFFKQNFQNIKHETKPSIIDYDVKEQSSMSSYEASRYTYYQLFADFPRKYYSQLTKSSYMNFISYLYQNLSYSNDLTCALKRVPFLRSKDSTVIWPENALLEESRNPIPDFSMLNPVDNEYLPSNNTTNIKNWLVNLGARRLSYPINIIRESIIKWLDSGSFHLKINGRNHIEIINYLANVQHFTMQEMDKLREKLLVLTESSRFQLAKLCYFPDTDSVTELGNVISDDDKISSSYCMKSLKEFFINVGVKDKFYPIDVLRKTIFVWIGNGEINYKLTISNYSTIIEYVSLYYPSLKSHLTKSEKIHLKEIPVLTSVQTLDKAQDCYFDSALPNVKGLECVIEKNKLVSTQNFSKNARVFLREIGVREEISPTEVLKRSVLRWIEEGQTQNRITLDNHHGILEFITKHWKIPDSNSSLSSNLDLNGKRDLKKIPLLTKNGTFRAADNCYFPSFNSDGNPEVKIPGLESIIFSDEFVSSDYSSEDIKELLKELGVRTLRFTDVYEKYSDHLSLCENVKWFFSHLIKYWIANNNLANKNELLVNLQKKFKSSSCLLAKNGKMYNSTELYSSEFDIMHSIDPNSVPLLDYTDLPGDLETWLGFKKELELNCITQLLEVLQKKPKLVEGKTLIFFTALLKQLERKDKNEIKKYELSLLSKDNNLKPAKQLNYFTEEEATCILDSCYLKRIHGMSHDQTLELAELCGVNTLSFKQEIKFGQEPACDNALKEFYLLRLPFIVLQESKELNESPSAALRRLYIKIGSIELYKCSDIFIQYPFGSPRETRLHFECLKIYVAGKWDGIHKSEIHDHVKEELGLKTDMRKIIDMEINLEDRKEWLFCKNESLEELQSIQNELLELLSETLHPKFYDSSSKGLNITSIASFQEVGSEKCHFKRLGEKYVFNFLQDHYKNKHPTSQFSSSDGLFRLYQQHSHEIEIIWLNEKEEKGHSYDLLLKKGGEVKRVIEVEISEFNLSHSDFIKRISCLAAELPQHKEKYCIYRVFNVEDPTTATRVEELNISSALYKVEST